LSVYIVEAPMREDEMSFNLFSYKTSNKENEFMKIYNDYGTKVYRTAFMVLRNANLAEEAVQEVFLTVYKKADSLRETRALEKWLYKVTVNACIDIIRKEKKVVNLAEADLNLILETDDSLLPESAVIANETEKEIISAIYSLPEQQRIPIILYYYNNLTYQDIAGIMNCPEGTIKSRIYTAKKLLKTIILNSSKGDVDNYGY
jgi:RNA polymerase sigma-70 factor (ECF subfamily)